MTELLTEEQAAEIREVIKMYDKKGDGSVSSGDVAIVFQALNCNVSNEEVNEFLKYLDPNGDGTVSEDDLMPVIAKRLQTKETVDNLLKAFKVFDKENRGTIHPWELKHILSHFGEIMDEAEIDEYLAEADNKAPEMKPTGEKTGKINYVAFAGVMLDLSEEQVMAMAMQ
ncbi:hypothetical protein T484DRAFT_1955710 [Baffinella frigidus]|nr:hypothetical protein T484DRAFT_1955710 [Cryptophyta sp. CCMP2293]